MFRFFIEKISSNQSGFKPGDTCVNQLVSIRQEIWKTFGEGHEVPGVFLDISTTSDNFQTNSKRNIREFTQLHA